MRRKNNVFLIFLIILIFFILPIVTSQSAYGVPIKKDSYEISRSKVEREISRGNIFKDSVIINNLGNRQFKVSASVSQSISEIIEFDSTSLIIEEYNYTEIYFSIIGKEIGDYDGELIFSGDIIEKIPVNVSIVNKSSGMGYYIVVESLKERYTLEDSLDFRIDIRKIVSEEIRNVSFSYSVRDTKDNRTYLLGSEMKDLIGSFHLRKRFDFPEEIYEDGNYILDVSTGYQNKSNLSSTQFSLSTPFWSIMIFGLIPVWLLALIIVLLILSTVTTIYVRKVIERRKKYKMQLYTKTLPKKGERTFYLGKVAETNVQAYLDADALTTHGVVAGATGGGKSISAQVIIEEALLKNIAVIVFDPTAQWSGMLRKCTDKKMLSFYPKFGLKPENAKAFPGNLRYIKNERQAIDIKKYMNPGQIQIFALNKLTPPQIDSFVAGVISNIFKSDPKEHPVLRVMLVFDEVHRLLPKFGGSGKGFLQIERACREFRKWGFGVMLVSQVLSDFVGEIKANINTEVQMRTRDEADLNRLKTKYGEEFLQSLIKASVGVGMFVNPKYNKGKPYFVNFRPILHNTRRLTDEVLEKYNEYGEKIDDLEYQIEQLEKEKVDVFDLKMELKLVKDKLMAGNFTVVDIYLEGLSPRIEKQWQTIGKKPKKREIELIDESELATSLQQAQKDRTKWEKEEPVNKEGESKEENVKKEEGGKEVEKGSQKDLKKVEKKEVKEKKKIESKGKTKKPVDTKTNKLENAKKESKEDKKETKK